VRPRAALGRAGATALAVGLTLLLGWGSAARAQKGDKQPPTPPPAGMRAKVFLVKHQDVESLVDALKPLTSGVPGAMLRSNEALRTVTVRDFPENIGGIEQAIKRLDVPGAARPDVELRIHVLVGLPNVVSGPVQYPSELDSVVRQLSATLSYRSYHQIAAITQRMRPDSGASGKGELALSPPVTEQSSSAQYEFSVHLSVGPPAQGSGPLQVSLRRFRFELEGGSALGEAEVSAGFTMRDGEKVVVGTGSLKNRAMIVVLTARLLR
jgi:hypothetical protein